MANSDSDFDPFNQPLTFRYADGTPFVVTVDEVDTNLIQYSIRSCINYASQLGASIAIFVILLLLTRPEKRGSAVFALNASALLCNIGRTVCQVTFFSGAFVRLYPYFSGDYSRVPRSAYAGSVLGTVFPTLQLICFEASLLLQVEVVCANLRRRYRRSLVVALSVIAFLALGFRFTLMVLNSMLIMEAAVPHSLQWLESAANITLTISICIFCAVFVVKLGFAIHLRKRLGVREFGPMKVIFIMGCQTLVIPAIFSILQYVVNVPELSSNVLTLVTLSLPLSNIWASTTLSQSSTGASTSRANLWNGLTFSGGKQMSMSTSSSTKPSTTVCYSDQVSPKAPSSLQQVLRKNEDEAEQGYGIAIEHDISVRSVRKEKKGDV
ncbi:alpha-factor pheromone receptor STE2 [Aspergillus melleus]|uniref:alpha-factor pheromone receptor STE2 n=1 Tax=Aspergillus melleus TaxID=138277 RepID=UPI001E8E9678|nr:pheromone alpha factor receptor [Aspergillus melleus]KAH8424353.1 pheromone alpha factor receptor [Aspergillus melleus]